MIGRAIQDFDDAIHLALNAIAGAGNLSDANLLQARLPSSKGGVGLTSAQRTAAPAFLSSVTVSMSLQLMLFDTPDIEYSCAGFARCLADFQAELDLIPEPLKGTAFARHFYKNMVEKGENDGEMAVDVAVPEVPRISLELLESKSKPQRFLSALVTIRDAHKLYEMLDTPGRAVWLGLLLPFAHAWLNTPPIKVLDLHLPKELFRAAIRHRLRMPVYRAVEGTRKLSCNLCSVGKGKENVWGDHAVQCPGRNGTISRHNHVRDVLVSLCKSAGFGNVVPEARELVEYSKMRPADFSTVDWPGPTTLIADVAVSSALSYDVAKSAVDESFVVERRAADKKAKYATFIAAKAGTCTFKALVFEANGGAGKDAATVIRTLGRALADKKGIPISLGIMRVASKVSMAVVRATAYMLNARQPVRD